MTSNIGSSAIAASGARSGDAAYEQMKREVTESLSSHFRPEFLNRVDEVIVFHALTENDLERIVGLLVADLAHRLASQDIELELTEAARALLVREGTDPAYGARPLKRVIQRELQNPMAIEILEGNFHEGDTIRVERAGEHLRFVRAASDVTTVKEALSAIAKDSSPK
jgi:ATP-dependent Clp protease ATP-binding subunit ClpB